MRRIKSSFRDYKKVIAGMCNIYQCWEMPWSGRQDFFDLTSAAKHDITTTEGQLDMLLYNWYVMMHQVLFHLHGSLC